MIRGRCRNKEMDARMRILTILLLALAAAGCQLLPERPADAVYQRGVLVLRDEGFMFRACARQQWQPVVAVPERVAEEHRRQRDGQPELPLYIEGWAAPATTGWALLEPRLIGGGLQACEQHLEGMLLLGAGEEPYWSLRLESQRMVLNDPAQLRRLIFREPELTRRGHLWQWRGQIEQHNETLDLLFEVEARPCRDRAGHWYALTARADLEGAPFTGCARYGDLQLLDLSARYDSGERYLRGVTLLLRGDGRARLVVDARNGQPLAARAGTWRLLGVDRLLLELAPTEPGDDSETLLWRRLRDGRLRLVSAHPEFGRLALDPAATPLQWERRALP